MVLVLERGQRDGLLQQGDGSMGRFCSQTGGAPLGKGKALVQTGGETGSRESIALVGPGCVSSYPQRACCPEPGA